MTACVPRITERIYAGWVKVPYEADCEIGDGIGTRHELDTLQFMGTAK